MPSKPQIRFRAQQRPRQQQLAQQQQREGDPDPKPTADGIQRDEFVKVMGQVVDILGQVQDTNQKLLDHKPEPSPTPTPQPKPQPKTVDPSDAVQAFLSGDLGPLKEALAGQSISQEQFNELRQGLDELRQVATLQVTDAIPQNEAHFREQVDGKWGKGAYDSIYKPELEGLFKDQPGLRANRAHFNSAISMVTGNKVEELLAHKKEVDEAAAKEDAEAESTQAARYPFMLGGGVPMALRDGKVSFDGQDEDWIRKYELHNGETFDREQASKMIGALAQSSQGKPMVTASLEDLEKAFPQQSNGDN